jgi:adsorption protein B
MLHDAEDMVHPLELRVVAQHLESYAAVQLPVLPLRYPGSRFVSGHYLDEFAEAHGKVLLVRQALGAGLPLAGVGCAIRRDMLDRIAGGRGGEPFDASSLTEDYELGLTIGAMGARTVLARVAETPGGGAIGVRAYFPDTVQAAVRQKARWLTGIALAGWDRTGWGRAGRVADHWMRMRDRRATLAIPVLVVAYCALLLWGLSWTGHAVLGLPAPELSPGLRWLLAINAGLLLWRMLVRATFVGRTHGWREGLWSVPRIVVANYIMLLAGRRALFLYLAMLRGSGPRWEKTAHEFPHEQSAS